jgi:predicted Zn-dependent protease with MMP-like domain
LALPSSGSASQRPAAPAGALVPVIAAQHREGPRCGGGPHGFFTAHSAGPGGHGASQGNPGPRRPGTPHNRGVLTVGQEEFETLVGSALDSIPRPLATLIDNVAVFVEDEPNPPHPGLLGLYEGVPLTARGQWYAGVLPDRITIYRLPILRICGSRQEVADQVRITVVHEIAHHFGIDDAKLRELGY